MKLEKIGEFGLIKRFTKRIKLDRSVKQGPGDDCAVINFTKDKYMLLTCDMIVQGVDFYPDEKPYLVGRKALGVSISDIAACAGIPKYALVCLGLPKSVSVEFVDKLTQGMFDLAKRFKINIVGGDISKAPKLFIDTSVVGFVEKKNLVLRSNAKVGDLIFVTGSLGGSIVSKHLKFSPRVREARYLVKNFKINSMIDVSDGLAADLGHILSSSNVGAVIWEKFIPASPAARGLDDCLYGGEDFELLFTAPRNEANRISKNKVVRARPIGEIVKKSHGVKLLDGNYRQREISPRGYKHF